MNNFQGVQPEVAPGFFKHLSDEMPGVGVHAGHSLADAIAVSHVGVNSFLNGQQALDKVVRRYILLVIPTRKTFVLGI